MVVQATITGPASPGGRYGKASILDWWGEQDGCTRPGLHLWGAQACLPAWQGRGPAETTWVADWFPATAQPMAQPELSRCSSSTCSTSHSPRLRTEPRCETLSWLTPEVQSEQGRDSHCWCLGIRGSLDLWWWPDYHTLHPSPDQIHKIP